MRLCAVLFIRATYHAALSAAATLAELTIADVTIMDTMVMPGHQAAHRNCSKQSRIDAATAEQSGISSLFTRKPMRTTLL
jgi:hypothetical protein